MTVTIPMGSSTGTTNIDVVDDELLELQEDVIISVDTFMDSTYDISGAGPLTVLIDDNEGPSKL